MEITLKVATFPRCREIGEYSLAAGEDLSETSPVCVALPQQYASTGINSILGMIFRWMERHPEMEFDSGTFEITVKRLG